MFTYKKYPETYAEVFRQLHHLPNKVVSYSLMIGFEQGTIVALNQKYPLVSQTICLFDLSKSIYGHLQELGLSMAASGLLKAFGASHSFPKVYKIILIFT